jgi:hypothetical protein
MRPQFFHVLIYLQPTRWLAHQKQEKLASSQGSGIRSQKAGYKRYGCEISRAEDADDGVRV